MQHRLVQRDCFARTARKKNRFDIRVTYPFQEFVRPIARPVGDEDNLNLLWGIVHLAKIADFLKKSRFLIEGRNQKGDGRDLTLLKCKYPPVLSVKKVLPVAA